MSVIRLGHFTELLDLALRLPGRLQYDVEASQEALRDVGLLRVQVFAGGLTARDYAVKELGRLTIRAWGPPRAATPDERRRLQIKLVDAAVDAKGDVQ